MMHISIIIEIHLDMNLLREKMLLEITLTTWVMLTDLQTLFFMSFCFGI